MSGIYKWWTLINFLKSSNVKNIICMPENGNKIYEQLKDIKQVYK